MCVVEMVKQKLVTLIVSSLVLDEFRRSDGSALHDISGTIEYGVVRTPLSRPGVRVRKVAHG